MEVWKQLIKINFILKFSRFIQMLIMKIRTYNFKDRMLKYLFLSVSMLMMVKSDPVEIEDLGNPMKYKLPYELPDQN